MTGPIVIPAEHFTLEATGATQIIAEDTANNETTVLYTVPTSQSAYWTDILLSIKSVSILFQTVKIAFTDDSAAVTYDYNIYVGPWETKEIFISFKHAVKMDEDDTLAIISPIADITVAATANLILAA